MEGILFIGLLIFLGSLLYLAYHYIRKIKNRERRLSRKWFYPILIGGFLLFIIGLAFIDTSVQKQLDEALDYNSLLTAENNEIKAKNIDLDSTNTKLKEENEKAHKEIEELKDQQEDQKEKLGSLEKELKDQQTAHKEETGIFKKEIDNLKASNSSLQEEIDSLKTQLASKSSSSTASSSGGSSKSASPSSGNTSQASAYYKNCTAARAAGVTPLRTGDPGYAKHLDRDGDGVACE